MAGVKKFSDLKYGNSTEIPIHKIWMEWVSKLKINRWDFQPKSIMTPYFGFLTESLDNDVEELNRFYEESFSLSFLGGPVLSFLTRKKNATIPIKSGKSTKAMPTRMPIRISINITCPVGIKNGMAINLKKAVSSFFFSRPFERIR
jgi:hypothetical protein